MKFLTRFEPKNGQKYNFQWNWLSNYQQPISFNNNTIKKTFKYILIQCVPTNIQPRDMLKLTRTS